MNKKLTTNGGCPVAHNQNIKTAGPRRLRLLENVCFLKKALSVPGTPRAFTLFGDIVH